MASQTRHPFPPARPRPAPAAVPLAVPVPVAIRGPAALATASAAALAAALAPSPAGAAPDVRTVEGEYIAIAVEAEDASTSDERWIRTDATTAPTEETTPDPDGNHSDGAAGGVYLELLPDNRVTHGDTEFEPGTPGWYWAGGGQGPEMAFDVDFPEPGRYYVHARAFSTGSEDNGIHVGLDGQWPASGERIQWCAKQRWVWSSQQRGFPKDEHCGKGERTIWVDVPEAGTHEVRFSAREDGFELDRFMLIKDLSDGTRVCLPTDEDDVRCEDGSLEAVDGYVDVGVELAVDPVDGAGPARREALATVDNRDGEDAASLVTLGVALGADWTLVEADPRCSVEGEALACALGDLAPGASTPVGFTLDATRSGTVDLGVSVSANEEDDDPANDAASVAVSTGAPSLDASIELASSRVETGGSVEATIVLSNSGEGAAGGASAALTVPDSLDVVAVPEACTDARPVVCAIGELGPDESRELGIELLALVPDDAAVLLLDAAATDVGPMTASATLEIVPAKAPGGGADGEGGGDEGEGDGTPDAGDERAGDTGEGQGEPATGGERPGGGGGVPVTRPDEVDGDVADEAGSDTEGQESVANSRSSGSGASGALLLAVLAGTATVRRRRAGK